MSKEKYQYQGFFLNGPNGNSKFILLKHILATSSSRRLEENMVMFYGQE
jgi:hypothetical protein